MHVATATVSSRIDSSESEEITGRVLNTMQLFDKDILYDLPQIQRPYDWGVEEAGELFDDLYNSLEERKEVRFMEPYTLGCINLAAGIQIPGTDLKRLYVVDGQQRIVTLLMLFAAAHEHLRQHYPPLANIIAEILKKPQCPVNNYEEQLRVHLKSKEDTDFLEQLLVRSSACEGNGPAIRGDSQPKLWRNMQLLKEKLSGMPPERIKQLVNYTLTRVKFTVTTSSTISIAYRYFSSQSKRGKDLQPVDFLKGDVFNPEKAMPQERHDEYGRRWAELEQLDFLGERLGRDGISYICSLLPVMYLKFARGKRDEIEELSQLFKSMTMHCATDSAGPAFFDQVLKPHAEMYVSMLSGHQLPFMGCSDLHVKRIQYLLVCLHRLSPKVPEWQPLALAALMQHRNSNLEAGALLRLLEKLDRLVWMWVLCGVIKAKRTSRITQALRELGLAGEQQRLEKAHQSASGQQGLLPCLASQESESLELTAAEVDSMVAALDGPLYASLGNDKGRPLIQLLLRLNEFKLQQNDASYVKYDAAFKKLTVEHILPQKPNSKSDWSRIFTEDERQHWVHRLGNLVLLHSRLNSKASNHSFREKKQRYHGEAGRISLTNLPLTDDIGLLPANVWSPNEVKKKQQELVHLARQCWRLY